MVEYADLVKIALLVLACVFNTQAFLVLCLHIANEALFKLMGDDPVAYFCAAASMYAVGSVINIRILSPIRCVLLLIGLVNWFEAIDYMLFPYQTLYGLCYPWLVNGFDVLILILLFRHRGRDFGGRTSGTVTLFMGASSATIHNFNLWMARLYLLQRFKKQDPK